MTIKSTIVINLQALLLCLVSGLIIPDELMAIANSGHQREPHTQLNFNWGDLDEAADGWLNSQWFGWFREQSGNWIEHTQHGWLYVSGNPQTGCYFYDVRLNFWFWSNADMYPTIYAFGNRAGWYYFYREFSAFNNRWFHSYSTGEPYLEQEIMGQYIFRLDFETIGAGSFTMGSPEDVFGRGSDETQHTVRLSRGFTMTRTEITNEQFAAIMTWGLREGLIDEFADRVFNSEGDRRILFTLDRTVPELNFDGEVFSPRPGLGKHPVRGISWYAAMYFCYLLTERENWVQTIDPENWTMDLHNFGYRLPTEAEWEYACRAGTDTAFNTGPFEPKGSLFSVTSESMDAAGWYDQNSNDHTHPVGRKKPNARGLYDMHGNVPEWVYDWYGEYNESGIVDPMGPRSGTTKVHRGGGAFTPVNGCTSSARTHVDPNVQSTPSTFYHIGFRIVRVRPIG